MRSTCTFVFKDKDGYFTKIECATSIDCFSGKQKKGWGQGLNFFMYKRGGIKGGYNIR